MWRVGQNWLPTTCSPFFMKMTPELETQINAAMQAAGGSITAAATLLGLPMPKVRNFIHNNAGLKAKWAKSNEEVQAPSEAITLSRPMLPDQAEVTDVIMAGDEEVARAVDKEDALVRKGLDAMGVKGSTLDMAMALQSFQRAHFTKAMDILGGGVTKQALDLMVEIEAISNTLNDPTTTLEPARELMLREDRAKLLDLLGKFYDRASNAVLVQAKVRAMQKDKDKPKKPKGFLAIQAQPGSTVNVSAPNEQD